MNYIVGTSGDDTFLQGTVGDDVIDSLAGNDTIVGQGGNDIFIGGPGYDTMYGGGADDVFLIGVGDDIDQIIGNPGYDRVLATADNISIGLGRLDQVEEINANGHIGVTLTIESQSNWVDLRGTTLIGIGDIYIGPRGSQLVGTTFADRIFGGAAGDVIDGGGGQDLVHGGGGNDTLVVRTGAYLGDGGDDLFLTVSSDLSVTTLTGGAGRDTYVLYPKANPQPGSDFNDLSGVADVVTDFQAGWGGDRIAMEFMRNAGFLIGWDGTDPFSAGYFRLFQSGADTIFQVDRTGTGTAYVDALRLQNVQASTIIFDNFEGHPYPNGPIYSPNNPKPTAIGTDYHDLINGGAIDDIIVGYAGDDRLYGNAGNDTIYGGLGNDTIDGGAGNDTASYADAAAAVQVSLAITKAQNTGGSGSDTLISIENLEGSAYADKLTGNSGSNTLSGGAGNDVINGGAGSDVLIGGAGNDTYTVDNVGDQIIENVNEGTDAVKASVDYTLSANVEKLTQTGTANITGTGNDLANTLTGNGGDNVLSGGLGKDTLSGGAGNDTLNGGAGADKLTGGTGNDLFLFDIMQTATNKDTIVDFTVGQDHIGIARSAFAAFSGDAAGVLNPAEFALGTAATTSSQHLIYNSGTGALFYDADGVGGVAQVQIALLSNHAVLSSGDIILI